jgi:hypothetical protein
MQNFSKFMRFPAISAALLAGALVTTGAPTPAAAQGKAAKAAPDKKAKDTARKAYGEGEKAFGAGKYEDAYGAFKKAYEAIPTPHAEYWMAAALDKQGKSEEAAAAYAKFLDNPGHAKAGAEKVDDAKKRLEQLKGKSTGELNIITTPAGATVMIDGQPQMGEAPMIVKLAPGKHTVAISSPGYQNIEREIEVKAGEKQDLSAELVLDATGEPAAEPTPEPVAPPPDEPPPASSKSKVPAYVTLGIAGAGALVGTFFGIKALSAKSDFKDKPTTDAADDVERNALIADMAFGVAITLGVTGVVLLTSADSDEKVAKSRFVSGPRLRVAPVIGPTGGGAAAHLTF